MNAEVLKKILSDLRAKKISEKEAFSKLKTLPYANIGIANIDSHRHIRKGFPEAVYCEGKTFEQNIKIIKC